MIDFLGNWNELLLLTGHDDFGWSGRSDKAGAMESKAPLF